MKRTPFLLFICSLCACNLSMANTCTAVDKDFKALPVTFNPGTITLDIPRDTPNGTVVYERVFGRTGDSLKYNCLPRANLGLIPESETQLLPGSDTLFELKGTGLSWSLSFNDGKPITEYSKSTSTVSGIGKFYDDTLTLKLVKTSTIPTGSFSLKGPLANYVKGGLPILTLTMNATIRHAAATCKSPDVHAQMGDTHTIGSITSNTPRETRFDIALFDCSPSIRKIQYMLKPNTSILDLERGVVALSADSTAKGLGIQILNRPDQRPVVFNENVVYSDSMNNETMTNYQIPFSAYYRPLPGERVTAGTANSSITFIMTYL